MNINSYIDHTLLSPTATETDIIQLCEDADKHQFFAVCVNSCFVPLAKTILSDSNVKICSVIGFPLGAMSTKAKAFEAEYAIAQGADEIDMVINLGLLKIGNENAVIEDIKAVKRVCGPRILKVIIETCELTKNEIIEACELSVKAGADFVKTSTGFGKRGATLTDVKIMKKTVKSKAMIKASGGIKNYETAQHYLQLGVERIGTSSGIKIVKQAMAK